MANMAIAEALSMSVRTVEGHLLCAHEKLAAQLMDLDRQASAARRRVWWRRWRRDNQE
jgi:hypothetical protein